MLYIQTNNVILENPKTKLQATKQQQAVINLALTGADITVEAYAGAAKTTTLVMVVEELAKLGKKGMYVAYNKAIATEASREFNSTCECRTIHSLAYRSLPNNLKSKLTLKPKWASDYAKKFNFKPMYIPLRGQPDDVKMVSVNAFWTLVRECVANYCRSSDESIARKHFQKEEWMWTHDYMIDGLVDQVVNVAKKYWEEMCNPKSDVPITHDFYLKQYALSNEELVIDYLLLDEAQDCNPVMVQIVERYKGQKILVGDRYQNIYGFNKTMNIMDNDIGTKLALSKSFRFGNAVQDLANVILTYRGNETPLEGNGDDKAVRYFTQPESFIPDAIICRTNSGVIESIFECMDKYPDCSIKATVDVKNITSFIYSYLALEKGEMKEVKHPLLFGFKNFADLTDYLQDSPDPDIKKYDELMKRVGATRIIAAMTKCEKSGDADILITTAHKSKGLTLGNVIIHSDFQYKLKTKSGVTELKISDDELNLIYVAITRAKKDIVITNIADLIAHLHKENTTRIMEINREFRKVINDNVGFKI